MYLTQIIQYLPANKNLSEFEKVIVDYPYTNHSESNFVPPRSIKTALEENQLKNLSNNVRHVTPIKFAELPHNYDIDLLCFQRIDSSHRNNQVRNFKNRKNYTFYERIS